MSYIYIWFSFVIYIMPFYLFIISEINVLFGLKMNKDDECLANYATTDTILWNKRYFLELTLIKANVSFISGTTNLVEGSGRANITLPNETRFHINDAFIF